MPSSFRPSKSCTCMYVEPPWIHILQNIDQDCGNSDHVNSFLTRIGDMFLNNQLVPSLQLVDYCSKHNIACEELKIATTLQGAQIAIVMTFC